MAHVSPPDCGIARLCVLALLAAGAALPAAPGPDQAVAVSVAATHTLPMPAPALKLAFLGPGRLVALGADEVVLFAVGEAGLTLLSRRTLPGPLDVVRFPGGLLQASEPDAAVWALGSRSRRAVLLAVERSELVERQQAEALPFASCPGGLRFRPGTNLIEGEIAGLGPGPFLDVAAAEVPLAVAPDGQLLSSPAPEADTRVGPTLAPLWPGLVAASLPSPPTAADAVVVLARDGTSFTPVGRCPLPGAVRALAARLQPTRALLAAAIERANEGPALVFLDVVRPAP